MSELQKEMLHENLTIIHDLLVMDVSGQDTVWIWNQTVVHRLDTSDLDDAKVLKLNPRHFTTKKGFFFHENKSKYNDIKYKGNT